MGRGKNLNALRELDEKVLSEVIREGELMMAAQFAAATASDQRAMTWCGFVMTLTTAAVGATATIAISGKHLPLAVIAALLSVLLGIATFQAMRCVRPDKFALPGNRPENWLPSEWEDNRPKDLLQARVEQARCLNNLIDDNARWATRTARLLHESMDVAAIAILLAAVATGGYVLFRLAGA